MIRSDRTDASIVKQASAEKTIYLAYQANNHYKVLKGAPASDLAWRIQVAEIDRFGNNSVAENDNSEIQSKQGIGFFDGFANASWCPSFNTGLRA